REALELPALLERLAASCSTDPGGDLARQLEPSPDEAEVRARHLLTSEAVALLDAAEEPDLRGLRDVRAAAARAAREGLLEPAALRAVATAIRVALAARAALAGSTRAPRLAELAARADPALAPVADRIDDAVEADGSDLRDGASPLLRRLRAEVASGAARIHAELERVARSDGVRAALQESFLAERGGRPVLAVRGRRARQPPRRGGRRGARGGGADPARALRPRRGARARAHGARRGGGAARPGPRLRRPLATPPRRAGRDRRRGVARRRAPPAARPGGRRPDRPRPRRPAGARDQRPQHRRQDGRPEDARARRAPPPVRHPAARRAR